MPPYGEQSNFNSKAQYRVGGGGREEGWEEWVEMEQREKKKGVEGDLYRKCRRRDKKKTD